MRGIADSGGLGCSSCPGAAGAEWGQSPCPQARVPSQDMGGHGQGSKCLAREAEPGKAVGVESGPHPSAARTCQPCCLALGGKRGAQISQ